MPVKVGMISLGCPKNQIDAEGMLAGLKGHGYKIEPDAGLADVVIINTCGFIEDAKKESIENILEMAQLKKEGRIRGIVVSGCLAERYFKQMREEIPEINCVLSVGRAGDIEQAVKAAYAGDSLELYGDPEMLSLNGGRALGATASSAYLKIAEGCDNRCTYCIIPKLRGRYRSRRFEDIVQEAERLAANGARELVLVAQDTSRYGSDLYGRNALPELLQKLCRVDGIKWIRLLYCYPERISDELIETIANEPKIVKYIDMPIQHVNRRIVKAMNRQASHEQLTALVGKLRQRIPGVTLRTTLIVGFPGETEEEFAELSGFVRDTGFDRLGAFAYSREDGTPAAELPGQIEEDVKTRRQEIIMDQQSVVSEQYCAEKEGAVLDVLTEGYDRYAGCYFGRSQAEAPEIDGKVFFKSKDRITPGTFVNVKITGTLDFDLFGEKL